MLDALLLCESCGHGAALHAGGGCEVFRCHCADTKDRIVEDAVVQDREAYRRQWHTDVAV